MNVDQVEADFSIQGRNLFLHKVIEKESPAQEIRVTKFVSDTMDLHAFDVLGIWSSGEIQGNNVNFMVLLQ